MGDKHKDLNAMPHISEASGAGLGARGKWVSKAQALSRRAICTCRVVAGNSSSRSTLISWQINFTAAKNPNAQPQSPAAAAATSACTTELWFIAIAVAFTQRFHVKGDDFIRQSKAEKEKTGTGLHTQTHRRTHTVALAEEST